MDGAGTQANTIRRYCREYEWHFSRVGELFHYCNSSKILDKVRVHAEDRLRTHLMKRHRVKDRGTDISRFPSQHLWTKYELYKVPTTVGGKSAHA